jgi:hypothetical protein
VGRVEDHLGDRLRGRAVPDDLRRLVELELDGVLDRRHVLIQPFAEMRVLGAGELHDLQDPGGRHGDADRMANWLAIDDVLSHTAVVVDGFNGDLFGYWLHPDEPPSDRPPILKLDTEGQFDIVPGTTLVEALVFDWLGDDPDPDELARVVDFCDRHGFALSARRIEDLPTARPVVDPAVLCRRQYWRRRPFTKRPSWTDTAVDAAPIGLPVTDPRLRDLLQRLGFPDPEAAVTAGDEGIGEVRLASPVVPVRLRLYLDPDDSWWLFLIRFNRPDTNRPGGVPLPYGLRFDENRDELRRRLGTPRSTALAPVDTWVIGHVLVYVLYAADGRPKYVECWPDGMHRR